MADEVQAAARDTAATIGASGRLLAQRRPAPLCGATTPTAASSSRCPEIPARDAAASLNGARYGRQLKEDDGAGRRPLTTAGDSEVASLAPSDDAPNNMIHRCTRTAPCGSRVGRRYVLQGSGRRAARPERSPFAQRQVPLRRTIASDPPVGSCPDLAGRQIPERSPGQTHLARGVSPTRPGYNETETRNG